MLIQSLATNLIFYVGAYILYLLGIFQPTLTGIAILFGLGMTFDSMITFLLFIRFSQNNT